MPITTSLITDIGKVRLEIGDADSATGMGKKPDGTNLTDDEIQYCLDQEGSVRLAAAKACELLARAWSNVANISVGGRSEGLGSVADGWMKRAQELRAQAGGGIRIRRLARPANLTSTEYSSS